MLLDPAVGKIRTVRAANPDRKRKKPCVYVGMTGLAPEERFGNHKAGIKAASVVTRYGLRLLPKLYAYANPMPYDAAREMEKAARQEQHRLERQQLEFAKTLRQRARALIDIAAPEFRAELEQKAIELKYL